MHGNFSARHFLKALGPGLLFAGAAVGVSHLVQSTRAGANFGFGLSALVLAACLFKYPAFSFGPRYAAATGTSLLEGYRRQGRWALALFGLLTVGTMFTIQAAVTFTTAALATATFGLDATLGSLPTTVVLSALLTVICAGLLAAGSYRWLDRIVKVVVAILTLSTVAATALVLVKIDWRSMPFQPPDGAFSHVAHLSFMVALVGWMPSAFDISVWQSLWTLARSKQTGHAPSVRESMLDFNIGYLATVALALCFITLGAGVMYGSGERFKSGAAGFATQIIQLYTHNLGEWSRPLIGLCAFTVMFSTTLSVVDGFPRTLSCLIARFQGPEDPKTHDEGNRKTYWAALFILALGSMVVIGFMLKSLTVLVDLATILSFMTAPALALLNHRAIHGQQVPKELQPKRWLTWLSMAGIAFSGLMAAYFVWVRFLA